MIITMWYSDMNNDEQKAVPKTFFFMQFISKMSIYSRFFCRCCCCWNILNKHLKLKICFYILWKINIFSIKFHIFVKTFFFLICSIIFIHFALNVYLCNMMTMQIFFRPLIFQIHLYVNVVNFNEQILQW